MQLVVPGMTYSEGAAPAQGGDRRGAFLDARRAGGGSGRLCSLCTASSFRDLGRHRRYMSHRGATGTARRGVSGRFPAWPSSRPLSRLGTDGWGRAGELGGERQCGALGDTCNPCRRARSGLMNSKEQGAHVGNHMRTGGVTRVLSANNGHV